MDQCSRRSCKIRTSAVLVECLRVHGMKLLPKIELKYISDKDPIRLVERHCAMLLLRMLSYAMFEFHVVCMSVAIRFQLVTQLKLSHVHS